jgi:uncharacterized circularly permuted ATP-grasp superfamily protein/uncharacterized alpha-E superfamily protein
MSGPDSLTPPSDRAVSEPAAYDEMVSGKKSIRPHWREITATLWGMPAEIVREKQARAAAHLAAADQFLPESGDANQPIWSMDLLPLILPEAEWRNLSEGVVQRARLLNLVLADIYGPQKLIHEKLLPPYLVFNNPGFLRALRFVTSRNAPPLHFYAGDLVRTPAGSWRVLADRTQAPGGIGYALRHRAVIARSFPEAFRNTAVHRLQPTIDVWQSSLQSIGAAFDESPGIVLLTPGPHSRFYPEHVLLSAELGINLAQGSDLTVREGMVYLKTLNGLARVHVIYRRVDGEYCDPLELRADSALGVAGLIAAARSGNVVILNLPGSAVIETPAFAPFLPAIARRLLDEELKLPAVTTWWCGQDMPLREALSTPDKFVFQPSFSSDAPLIDPATMSVEDKTEFLTRLTATPSEFVAVERVHHSRTPVFGDKGLEPRPVVLRTCAISVGDTWRTLPGGVARIADCGGDQRPVFRQGGLVKDVWILKEDTAGEASAGGGLVELRKLHRVADAVGSRAADNLYWFGRYMERIDSGLRQFRAVTARLTRGTPGPRDVMELQRLARLLQATEWLDEAQALAPVDSTAFVTGITKALGPRGVVEEYRTSLRQLGIALRDRLSQDMWRVVSGFSRALQPGETDFDQALGNLDAAVLNMATLSGLVAENMTRGMGWRFLEIGRRIERAMAICSYIEGLFGDRPERVELSVRISLELCDSIITHRRRFPMDSYTLPALDVIMTDGPNPRSLLYQLEALRNELDGLISHDPLAKERELIDRHLAALRAPAPFAEAQASDRLTELTEGARACRVDLGLLSDALSRNYFTHVNAPQTIVTVFSGRNESRAAS